MRAIWVIESDEALDETTTPKQLTLDRIPTGV